MFSGFLCRYIQSACATSGEGLYEGLDWLSNNIATKVNSLSLSLSYVLFISFLETNARNQLQELGILQSILFIFANNTQNLFHLQVETQIGLFLFFFFASNACKVSCKQFKSSERAIRQNIRWFLKLKFCKRCRSRTNHRKTVSTCYWSTYLSSLLLKS